MELLTTPWQIDPKIAQASRIFIYAIRIIYQGSEIIIYLDHALMPIGYDFLSSAKIKYNIGYQLTINKNVEYIIKNRIFMYCRKQFSHGKISM